MSKKTYSDTSAPPSDWAHETLDKAVQEMTSLGVVDDALIEARAIWSLPYRVMIGQIRESGEQTTFRWIICGDLPTDHISSTVATTAREALRYFSLKWQMDAARYNDPATRKAFGLDEEKNWNQLTKNLVAKAEELYEMAEDDNLWRQPDSL